MSQDEHINSPEDWRRLQLDLLRTLQASAKDMNAKMDQVREEMSSIRDRLTRVEVHLEANDYASRLERIAGRVEANSSRLTIIETQGKVFTAGLAAGVSLVVSVIGAMIVYALKQP